MKAIDVKEITRKITKLIEESLDCELGIETCVGIIEIIQEALDSRAEQDQQEPRKKR